MTDVNSLRQRLTPLVDQISQDIQAIETSESFILVRGSSHHAIDLSQQEI